MSKHVFNDPMSMKISPKEQVFTNLECTSIDSVINVDNIMGCTCQEHGFQ